MTTQSNNRRLAFTLYVWCDNGHFEAFDFADEHEAALNGQCPVCGCKDLISRPPESHQKALRRTGQRHSLPETPTA